MFILYFHSVAVVFSGTDASHSRCIRFCPAARPRPDRLPVRSTGNHQTLSFTRGVNAKSPQGLFQHEHDVLEFANVAEPLIRNHTSPRRADSPTIYQNSNPESRARL